MWFPVSPITVNVTFRTSPAYAMTGVHPLSKFVITIAKARIQANALLVCPPPFFIRIFSFSPLYKILYLIFDYPHKHYTFKHFEV